MSEPGTPAPNKRAGWAERAGEWLSDEALTWLLLLLIVDMFVLPILGPDIGDGVINLVFTVLLFSGLAAVANRGIAAAAIGVFVLAAVVLKWIAPIAGLPGTPATAAVSAIVVFVIFTLLVLLRTLSPGPITRHRIEGAIATYLLIAMTFSFSFELAELLHPGSFDFGGAEPEYIPSAVSYFSLVTLTTVGYGDVTPVTPLARRLAMFEGFIGQMYPAVIIGWMVGAMKRRA